MGQRRRRWIQSSALAQPSIAFLTLVAFLDDQSLYSAECVLSVILASGYGLILLMRLLARKRPALRLAAPVLAGFALRVLAAAAVGLTPVAQTLRGGDESGFVAQAREMASTSLLSGQSLDYLTGSLQTWTFALQIRLFHAPEMALRVTQVAIATVALVLLSTAVHDLQGPRAARLGAWLLALEPTNVFFSGILHKEALMLLAGALVTYGGAKLWTRPTLDALVPMTFGCAIAVATRPYAGWFLIAATAAIIFHASIRGRRSSATASLVLASLVILLAVIAAPAVRDASSQESLARLQSSQDANAQDDSNLRLEKVNYSTPSSIAADLPRRIRDVLVRPYPWQVENTSQQLGLVGTLISVVCLVLLVSAALREGPALIGRAGPLIYIAVFLLVAYSLSAGNAGTAFRYRTHVLVFALCTIVTVYWRRRELRTQEGSAEVPQRLQLTMAR